MSNWSLIFPAGAPFKGPLPSADVTAIDIFLTKVPNFQDGSTHSAATQVQLTGAGAAISPFVSTDAAITITSTKALHVLTGGFITVDVNAFVNIAGITTFTGAVSFDHDAHVLTTRKLVIDNGAEIDIAGGATISMLAGSSFAAVGPFTTITLGSGVTLGLLASAHLTLAQNATASIDCGVSLTSHASFTLANTVPFAMGTGTATFTGSTVNFAADAIVNVSGSGAFNPALLNIGQFGLLSLFSGSLFTLVPGSTTNDASTRTRTGPEVKGGALAITGERKPSPPIGDVDITFDPTTYDIVDLPVTASVTRNWTLTAPALNVPQVVTFRRAAGPNALADLFLLDHTNADAVIGVAISGTARVFIPIYWNGSHWELF